jgi:hypothetical protein
MELKSSGQKNKLILVAIVVIALVGIYSISSSLLPKPKGSLNDGSKVSGGMDGTYRVVNGRFGFTTTKSELDKRVKAARLDYTATISSVIISGSIKRFSANKRVRLVEQGFSFIMIEDPDTGIKYYGASESIY